MGGSMARKESRAPNGHPAELKKEESAVQQLAVRRSLLLWGPAYLREHPGFPQKAQKICRRSNAAPKIGFSKKKSTILPTKYGAFLVENSGIEPLTSCMPCKRSPEPRTHAPPHKGAGMIDIRRYNALFRERRILTQKQLCCLNEFY